VEGGWFGADFLGDGVGKYRSISSFVASKMAVEGS
jgi:hypothetical protein